MRGKDDVPKEKIGKGTIIMTLKKHLVIGGPDQGLSFPAAMMTGEECHPIIAEIMVA